MLEKMIGVSPPLKGEAPDSKLAESKDLRGSSKSDYKRDFEKALDKKLEKSEKKTDDPAEKKQTQKSTELRADKKDKRSLGGNKKKVTEDDDKMVSNVMASSESKVEIPDSKIENPAEIEIDIPEKLKASVETEVKAATSAQAGLIQSLVIKPETAVLAETTSAIQSSLSRASGLPAEISAEIPNMQELGAAVPSQQQAQNVLPNQLSSDKLAAGVTSGNAEEFNLEAELGAAVGFNPDKAMKQTSGELLQKMKSFDPDKNSTAEKSQTFEQSILSRLQSEQVKTVNSLSEKSFSGESQGDSGQESSAQFADTKSDKFELQPLAAGQTQTEFSSQLGTAAAKGEALAGKLEDHREANVSEIMNKAQYLVTKGGGEVTVRMSPEGLGELQLKVILLDGKLSIEMQTQNKDIKKLVEESLTELKSGLGAHRLSLEHVKINTVDATNADNNTRSQSNFNQSSSGSQDQAREQWRDFQGNLNGRSDRKPSHADSRIQPAVSQRGASGNTGSALNTLRSYGGTKGATINRVA